MNKYKSQDEYHKRIGLIAKSYKIKKTVADDFRATCKAAGVSQAAQITKMMIDFIDQSNKKENKK